MPNITSIVHFWVTQCSSRHFTKQKGGYLIGKRRLIHRQTNDDVQDDNVDQDDNNKDASQQQEL